MHIIAAYDNAPYSTHAINSLRQLPLRDAIDLSLVTVARSLSLMDLSGHPFINSPAELVSGERKAIQQKLSEFADTLKADFRELRTHVPAGSPGPEIVALAETENAELIVLGAIGHSGIVRVMLGSVSDYVATHSHCSTLIIRPPSDAIADRLPQARLPGRVLIAIGYSETDWQLTDWIARLGLPTTTKIDLLFVIETRPGCEPNLVRKASLYMEEVRSAASKHMEQLRQRLESQGYCTKSNVMEASHIGRALVSYALKHRCDLIMTGDNLETLIERSLLGSTSLYVLRHATCDVLISK